MSEAILGAAAAVTVAAVLIVTRVLARRSAPAADGGADPVARRANSEPEGGSKERPALPDPNGWRLAVVFDLAAAEELLDRAESDGYQERELIVLGSSAFLVRWRDPR